MDTTQLDYSAKIEQIALSTLSDIRRLYNLYPGANMNILKEINNAYTVIETIRKKANNQVVHCCYNLKPTKDAPQ